MHVERENLPNDVGEVFFSDVFWYAASAETGWMNRPRAVGVGDTKEVAIANMREILRREPQ